MSRLCALFFLSVAASYFASGGGADVAELKPISRAFDSQYEACSSEVIFEWTPKMSVDVDGECADVRADSSNPEIPEYTLLCYRKGKDTCCVENLTDLKEDGTQRVSANIYNAVHVEKEISSGSTLVACGKVKSGPGPFCPLKKACVGVIEAPGCVDTGIPGSDEVRSVCRNGDGEITDVFCGKSRKCSRIESGGSKKSGEKKGDEKEENDSERKKNSEDSGSCFPASAAVDLENGRSKEMRSLKLGDRVKVGLGAFSDVYMFTHKIPEGRFEFVEIITASGHAFRATSGHYLYANDVLAPAGAILVGDRMRLGDGSESPAVSVERVVDEGIFAPQTVHGDILVNGIVSSTYTTFISPPLAHKVLVPMRVLYNWFGFSSSLLEQGQHMF